MHVMFIHPNFPAQFGHIANYLTTQMKWPCTYLTSIDTTHLNLPFNHINYKVYDGEQPKVFYNPDNLQGLMDHMLAIYKGLRSAPQIQPDLVVGHMSYGTMLYLRNLYKCPFIGYYELLPPPFWGDGMILRKEYPPPEGVRLFNALYHTFTYLHLHAVDACYTPTHFQFNTAPKEMQHKIKVIHDGVDVDYFQPRTIDRPTKFRDLTIPKGTRVVTYVSRGLESMRGFDIFMRTANKILKDVSDVVFLIAGDERTNYGHELHHLPPKTSFKQWVLSQDKYDMSKFHFLGLIPPSDLATLFNLSDLHFYLTTPYVLSWSMVQAMASGCTLLGSATAPVQEAVTDGVHGLLADFYDVDGLATRAIKVLKDPAAFKPLGVAARARVMDRYEARKCIGELVKFIRSQGAKVRDQVFANLGGRPPA